MNNAFPRLWIEPNTSLVKEDHYLLMISKFFNEKKDFFIIFIIVVILPELVDYMVSSCNTATHECTIMML